MVITIIHKIPNERIIDMLITAFEGGSNYWAIVDSYEPSKWLEKMLNNRLLDRVVLFKVYDREDEDDLLGTVTEISIRKGIRLMMEDYPDAYNRWMTEQYDAEDADIFLQLVTMGEVVFA